MFRRVSLSIALLATTIVAGDDPWRYVDPNSKLLLGIQWRAIRDSPLGAQFRSRINETMAGFPQFPGMGFLANIDNIVVASPGLQEGSKPGAQAPTLIVVTGNFDLTQIRGMLNKKSRRAVVQNIEIFESPDRSGPRMGIALVSTGTLLVGDTPTIVRTLGIQPSTATTLLVKAKQMDEDYQFWMVSSVSPENVTGSTPFPLPVRAEDIVGVDMGMSFNDGLGMELALRVADSEIAHKVKSEFAKMFQLAGKDHNNPEWANLDKAMKLTTSGETVRLTFHLDAAEVEQRFRLYQARHKAAPRAVEATVARPQPTNAKPVIWNAEPQDREKQ